MTGFLPRLEPVAASTPSRYLSRASYALPEWRLRHWIAADSFSPSASSAEPAALGPLGVAPLGAALPAPASAAFLQAGTTSSNTAHVNEADADANDGAKMFFMHLRIAPRGRPAQGGKLPTRAAALLGVG